MRILDVYEKGDCTIINYLGSTGQKRETFYNEDFNEEQIEFLNEQRKSYLMQSSESPFCHDSYERDMWYTMNRSGLFEEINWDPSHTRCYITNQ